MAAVPFPRGPESGREDKYIKTNELRDGKEVSVGCSERRAANYRCFSPKVGAALLRAKTCSVYIPQSSKLDFLSNAPKFMFPLKSWSLCFNADRLSNQTVLQAPEPTIPLFASLLNAPSISYLLCSLPPGLIQDHFRWKGQI